jgi:hypothetical protein
MSTVQPTRHLNVADSPGERADLGLANLLHDWTTTVDHKKIGIMYILMR